MIRLLNSGYSRDSLRDLARGFRAALEVVPAESRAARDFTAALYRVCLELHREHEPATETIKEINDILAVLNSSNS